MTYWIELKLSEKEVDFCVVVVFFHRLTIYEPTLCIVLYFNTICVQVFNVINCCFLCP